MFFGVRKKLHHRFTGIPMAESLTVLIDSVQEVHSFAGMWTTAKLNKVLELAEFDDISEIKESEQLDLCVMVVQDLDRQRAAELVLEAVFGDTMRPGVRQNLVDDLEEDQPWTDMADLAQQKGVFEAVMLLQQAFPNRYGTPDAARLTITLSGLAPASTSGKMTSERLLKVLAGTLNDRDILIRLYGDEIKSGRFNGADDIIWWMNETSSKPGCWSGELVASKQWFNSLQRGEHHVVNI